MLGAIGTGSYAAYLAATAAVSVLAPRLGARLVVGAGLVLAAAGMALIATASGPVGLAQGVTVAGASSALVFPPFSYAVATGVDPGANGGALSVISSGTGWGVAVAVAVALIAGGDWRAAWLAFAAIAVAVLAYVVPSVPGRTRADRDGPALRWAWFVCPRSGPLLAGALLVGLGASCSGPSRSTTWSARAASAPRPRACCSCRSGSRASPGRCRATSCVPWGPVPRSLAAWWHWRSRWG